MALAIAAGEYSRFAVDRRFPREKSESLYRIWIQRSVSGEIAVLFLLRVIQRVLLCWPE